MWLCCEARLEIVQNLLGEECATKFWAFLRTAEVAESDATRSAEQAEAAARARGEIAMTNAQAALQRKQNELRQIKAEVEAEYARRPQQSGWTRHSRARLLPARARR